MSFDYNKNKQHGSGDSFWTSYSDLFLGLSTIFLLLYVTASLRTGTDAIKAQVDNQKLTMKVEELQSQLKAYEQVKSDYLANQASKDEAKEYSELMDKLTLLKEDAKTDQERLARAALENEQKADALNKYQQMIRNIINANKVAKTKLNARNDIIDEQDTTIDTQKNDISTLQTDVATKRAQIAEGERRITTAQSELAKSKQTLLRAFKQNKMTKKQFEAKTKALQMQSENQIQSLRAANTGYSKQLSQLNADLKGTQSQLVAKSVENEDLKGQTAALQSKISGIKGEFEAQAARDRAAFDAELRKGKMDAAQRARREGEFRAAAAAKESEMQGKIAGLQGQVGGLQGQIGGLSNKLKDTEGALAKAKEEMDARREIAREIKKGFAAAGVKADVDMQTGEVVLDFGNNYFESDSAMLKPEMRDVIERAMPVYSKSLFGNHKVAEKISNVEIIGFASPTYQGRFVDPRSDKAADKAALKYNMDLSYRRANSIFGYLVENKDGRDFKHQRDLMALMKVSGRSFLEVMKVQGRNPATAAEFCKVNDCKKAQKVIVRFSMDGKK